MQISPRTTRRAFALGTLVLSAALLPAACGQSGEVVFGITSELAPGPSFTSLEARIDVDGAEVLSRSFVGSELAFPLELPAGEVSDGAEVQLELVVMQNDVPLMTQRAWTTGMEGRNVLYELKLDSDCVGVVCGEAETCKDAACISPFSEPGTLPDYTADWADNGGGGLCEPGGAPEVIVGEGQADFHSVEEGETLQVEAGPQGGYHVWIAARLKNLTQSGSITSVSGRFVDVDYEPEPSIVIFTFDPDEGDYCKIYGLRFRLDDPTHPIEDLLGRPMEISVSITDQNDTTASDTVGIVLSDDFI